MRGSGLRVLVVDDERLNRVAMRHQLRDAGYCTETAEDAADALARLRDGRWDVVVTDLRMPGMDGLELLQAIKRDWPHVDVMLMTAYGGVEAAVEAMRHGAAEFLTKPFRFEELQVRLEKVAESHATRAELDTLRVALDGSDVCFGLVGNSKGLVRACDRIRQFADHDAPVLVVGETGTGKELVARALHRGGRRARRDFVPVACSAIPAELAESELFGHERGAFTGAVSQHAGFFERAHRGTLVLDDIDDLTLDVQAKLLRVLQEGTLVRVGGSEEMHVDVRVVATSKVELSEAVAGGRFRDDLFYRLRGLEIHLPPLRERGDDVQLLASHFLGKLGDARCRLSVDAARLLRRWRWPGNVRELRRAMEAAVVVCPGSEVRPEHLPDYLQPGAADEGAGVFTLHLDHRDQVPFQDTVRSFEEALLRWALREAGGRQCRAAKMLGLPRTTLQSKLAKAPV